MSSRDVQHLIARDFAQQHKFESASCTSIDSDSGLISSITGGRDYPRDEIGTSTASVDVVQGMSMLTMGASSASELPIIFGRHPFVSG